MSAQLTAVAGRFTGLDACHAGPCCYKDLNDVEGFEWRFQEVRTVEQTVGSRRVGEGWHSSCDMPMKGLSTCVAVSGADTCGSSSPEGACACAFDSFVVTEG